MEAGRRLGSCRNHPGGWSSSGGGSSGGGEKW